MGQVFPPKIFDGMWVVAFGRQVQQHNGIGASIGADRLHGLHTLMVGEVAVAARDAVNQKCRTPGRGQQVGAVVGFDGQKICPGSEIQKALGVLPKSVANANLRSRCSITNAQHTCSS